MGTNYGKPQKKPKNPRLFGYLSKKLKQTNNKNPKI